MKKTIFICLATALVVVSCEKDRTCTCTETKTGTSTTNANITASLTSTAFPLPLPPIGFDTTFTSPVNETHTYEKKIEKSNKKAASANCISYTEPYKENTYNIVPNFTLTSTNSGERKVKCELK